MRFVAKLTLIALAVAPCSWAQQQPTFQAQTQLVVVPAVVTDHKGNHIDGLKKEDFSVEENGVEQKISLAEEVRTTAERVRRLPAQGQVYSNLLMGSPGAHRLTIIALDTINTPILDQARAKPEIIKFLSTWINGGEPVALVMLTRSGVKVIHDFSADPKILARALQLARNRNEQVVQEPTGEAGPEEDAAASAEEQAFLQGIADSQQNFTAFQRRVAATMTMEALQTIARAFSGIPGRKSLIWASSGFPFSISDQTMSLNAPGREGLSDMVSLYGQTWQALNDGQIAVYPVDLRGLVTLMPDASIARPSRNFHQRMSWMNTERLATFNTIASATGGRAFYNTNDISGAFRQAADDSSSYYLLAYYRDANDSKPGWRKLKVTVHRPGTKVRARSGFFVQKPAPTMASAGEVRKREIALAMTSPLDFTDIGVTASLGAEAAGKTVGKKKIPFELHLGPHAVTVDRDDKNHVKLDFMAVAHDAKGEEVAQTGQSIDAHVSPESLAKILQHGTDYSNALELPPGEYTIKFVVRDELSGLMGSLTAPVTVE